MDPAGVYLYCFARSGHVRDLEMAGIDGRPGVAALEVGSALAVFSHVSLNEFRGGVAGAESWDPARIVPLVCRHERVIEEVMRSGPVLPARFGTVFPSREALAKFLADKGEEVSRILDRLSDKEEWAVKGFVDLDRAKKWLVASDPVLAERARQMPESPGVRYFQEKRLAAEVEKALSLWRSAVAEQFRQQLKDHSVDVCPLRLQPRDVSGRDAEMVFNLALLVCRDRVPSLHAFVGAAVAAWAEQGLALDLSGPWPPYSFCPPMEASQGEAPGVLHSA